MSIFKPNDKVVCIDATPIPIYIPPGVSASVSDFFLPGGFIKEGSVYCVLDCHSRGIGGDAVYLAGKPVYLHGKEVSWSSHRFRKLEKKKQRKKKRARKAAPVKVEN